jgi:hypothetical protein
LLGSSWEEPRRIVCKATEVIEENTSCRFLTPITCAHTGKNSSSTPKKSRHAVSFPESPARQWLKQEDCCKFDTRLAYRDCFKTKQNKTKQNKTKQTNKTNQKTNKNKANIKKQPQILQP